MLTELFIKNFAIIDELDINFDNGFSTITGQTGAGKSIILNSLNLIAGERFDSKALKNSESKSIIEAHFIIKDIKVDDFYNKNEFYKDDSDECIIRRELFPNGRSRAFINDTPATLNQVKELSSLLFNIHSQNANLLLADHKYQLSLLDSLIGDKSLIYDYITEYNNYNTLLSKLNNLEQLIASARAEEEYNRFQYDKIASLNLTENEDLELEEQQKILSNVSDVKNILWDISNRLNNDNFSIVSELKQSINGLSTINGILNDIPSLIARFESLMIESKDILSTIDNINESVNDNPSELERVNDRLSAIYDLERKYNVSSVNDLISLQDHLHNKLLIVENFDSELESIKLALNESEARLSSFADNLTNARRNVADEFVEMLINYAKQLGLNNINARFNFEQKNFSIDGRDHVDLLISFNKNQPLDKIEVIASGGEFSRVMLCIKCIHATSQSLPTAIFDEIDTGVSGEIANKMGEMMRSLSKNTQVIAITHLPQVASLGDSHYKVYKKDSDDSTVTNIKKLSFNERVEELAGMLQGSNITVEAIENAKSLLKMNYEQK